MRAFEKGAFVLMVIREKRDAITVLNAFTPTSFICPHLKSAFGESESDKQKEAS